MYLISFLLVINSFVVTPVNQKLVFRPSFLTSTELESLTVHLSHLRDLTASVQESGSQSGIYKIHNEKEKLAKYRLVLQNEFEKQRRFLASKGLLSAIPRVDATEKEITGKFNELGKAIDNQDFEKVSSLLKYATPPPFPVDTQPPYQMLEPGKRIEPVKEGKRGIRTGPPTPDDTLPTIDVRITPEIKALAQQLGYDPRKIYEYVKNNVNYDPFYGSMKGSLGALYEQYGNDIDQASLLIALLRASGIPSRYVRGVITLSPSGAANMLGVVSRKRIIPTLLRSRIPFTPNTIGDSLVSVDMEYVWVRAYIPIQHYMGIPTGDERGKVWLPMFPAFKKLKITEGINLPEAMGFDFEEFFKDFIVNNPEAKTPIELYREKLTNYLNQNYPGKTYEEILLKEGVIEEKFQTLPLTSPVKVKYITDEFAEVPDELRHKLTLEVKATYSNNQYLI